MTRTRGPLYPWDEIVKRLRAQPGKWILHKRMVRRPRGLVKAIIERRNPKLRLDDGRIHTHIANRALDEDGRETVDIWLRFMPEGESSDH